MYTLKTFPLHEPAWKRFCDFTVSCSKLGLRQEEIKRDKKKKIKSNDIKSHYSKEIRERYNIEYFHNGHKCVSIYLGYVEAE